MWNKDIGKGDGNIKTKFVLIIYIFICVNSYFYGPVDDDSHLIQKT